MAITTLAAIIATGLAAPTPLISAICKGILVLTGAALALGYLRSARQSGQARSALMAHWREYTGSLLHLSFLTVEAFRLASFLFT